MKNRRLLLVTGALLAVLYLVWVARGGGRVPAEGPPQGAGHRPPAYRLQPTLSPEDLEDFLSFPGPERTTDTPTIPHIIHQVWDTKDIPRYFAAFVRSWREHHPDWEYWFWTHQDADRFVRAEFPEYYALYDSYISPIFRADAMRYFVLYKYGGVYADLDTQALRPLDNWTYGYQCVLSQECYVHSFVVQANERANLLNGFLAARPGHPLFLRLIESLPEFAGRYFGHYLRATGPLFLDAVYERSKGNYTGAHAPPEDAVTVVPPKFFMPTYDPSQSDVISDRCYPLSVHRLKPKGQRACREEVQDKFFQNRPGDEAYTNHEWIHAHMFDQSWRTSNTVPLSQVAPHAKDVTAFFNQKED